jgi:YHS domain-containing protein
MKRLALTILIIAIAAMGWIWMAIAEPETRVDPVCQMTVAENQTIAAQYNGQNYYFCSERCKQLFMANPAQYMVSRTPAAVSESSRGQTAGSGCGIMTRRASCGGCPTASSCFTSAAGSSSPAQSVQKSSVQEVNDFYAIFHPMYMAAQKGDAQPVRKSIEQLVKGAEVLNKAQAPEGINGKEFKKTRKSLQKSVKDLAKACKKHPDDKVISEVNTVHDRYMEFRSLVP